MSNIRRIMSSLLLATVAATLAVGCATEDELAASASDPTIELWIDASEIAGKHGMMTSLEVPGDEPVLIEGSACSCETEACRADFVRENLGDGICVSFQCGDERVGACVPLDPRGDVERSEGASPPPSTIGLPVVVAAAAPAPGPSTFELPPRKGPGSHLTIDCGKCQR